MDNIEFKCRIHWSRIVLRIVLSCAIAALSLVVVALLRQHCSIVGPLIPLAFLIGINVHSIYMVSKNKYSIKGNLLIVEESHLLKKREVINIPISSIDSCILTGWVPYQSIKLFIRGHLYTLRNVHDAAKMVDVINDKIVMRYE